MSDVPGWLEEAAARLGSERGSLWVCDGPAPVDDVAAAARSAGMEHVVIDAAIAGLVPFGVARCALPEFLGGLSGRPDAAFCADAVGEGAGAVATWEALCASWVGDPLSDDLDISFSDAGQSPAPAADPSIVQVELVRRVCAAAGEVAPRLVQVHHAAHIDGPSLATLRATLGGSGHAGTHWLLEGPIADGDSMTRALAPVRRAGADDRFEGPVVLDLVAPEAGDAETPSLPGRGTAVELLALLQAGGVPVPERVIGSESLCAYRGRPARASWQDLEGLIASGRADVRDGLVCVDDHGVPDPGPLRRADARALREAILDDALDGDPLVAALDPALAVAGEDADAPAAALAAGRRLLRKGDPIGARRWLDAAAGLGCTDPELALLRAEAARRVNEPDSARRLAREAVGAARGATSAALHLEIGLSSHALGDEKSALAYLERAATRGSEADDHDVAAKAALALAELHEAAGRHGPGAKAAASAARSFEQAGDSLGAARAFATRAVCIASAGQADRSIKELKLAMERTPDPDDPRPGALDVRIAMGLIFRESGNREKARTALALALKRAGLHGIADRAALARLNLARFFLEGIPTRGPERGEALSSGRESAEIAVQLARSLGRADLEAEAEALLGELAWRSEDWEGAAAALAAEETLWGSIGQQARVTDVALRRGRLAVRRSDWAEAFAAANKAMTQAQRRRLTDRLAQAHLLRAEALEKLDRRDEALTSLQEAHRIYGSLGDAFAAQAGAAERRARQLIADKRAQ